MLFYFHSVAVMHLCVRRDCHWVAKRIRYQVSANLGAHILVKVEAIIVSLQEFNVCAAGVFDYG